MVAVSVKKLADDVGTTVERLIEQFSDAGVKKSTGDDIVSENEKTQLLEYFKKQHGGESQTNRMTLKRKTKSTLNIAVSGGKSRSVQVEVLKKRTYVKRNTVEEDKAKEEDQARIKVEETELKRVENKVKKHVKKMKAHSQSLTEGIQKREEQARLQDELKQAEAAKAEEEARVKAEEVKRLAEENAKRWEEEEQARRKAEERSDYHFTTSNHAREAEDEEDRREEKNLPRRRKKKLIVREDNKVTVRSNTIGRRSRQGVRRFSTPTTMMQHGFHKPIRPIERQVLIGETISISELADKMAVKATEVIKIMMAMGVIATINQVIDQEVAQLVAEEMGNKVTLVKENDLEEAVLQEASYATNYEDTKPRAPVVTIMGHVNHGKTSLLDCIRQAKVADGEAGRITQHIGAYQVKTDSNQLITFLDTPGHAAFTAMRARGAQATDIVVLVVAADDGVMPQTTEAIQHSKAAGVPIIVAVNKIDKLESDPERIKNELAPYDVISEEWGGDTQFVYVSAKSGEGINSLLESILLQADILELTAPDKGAASGVVIESRLDKGRGPVATILVQQGQLEKGNIILCGLEYGRIRAMRNECGKNVDFAVPSCPVEILGLSGVPAAGNEATVVRDEKKAREVALYRQSRFRDVKLARQKKAKLENMFSTTPTGGVKELRIVLKADVQGSLEAISDSLIKLSTDEVKVDIIGRGVGAITETDATLAEASNALIFGFNVRADAAARRVIELESIDLHYYSIIYDLISKVKKAMSGLLSPDIRQEVIGLAEVREVFKSPKIGCIAGCMVTEGIVRRNSAIHVLRENVVVFEGELESIRRYKEDIDEVRNGTECGIGIKNYSDVRIGDQIEVFETVEFQRTL